MIHKGIRPTHFPLERDDYKKRTTYYENLPEGGYRMWNDKLLNSGCGRYVTDPKRDGNLIYCPICKSWNNINQFEE